MGVGRRRGSFKRSDKGGKEVRCDRETKCDGVAQEQVS